MGGVTDLNEKCAGIDRENPLFRSPVGHLSIDSTIVKVHRHRIPRVSTAMVHNFLMGRRFS
jgi:hypothetical protein